MPKFSRAAWRGALLVGFVAALVPTLFFGSFLLPRVADDPVALVMFSVFCCVAGLFFAIPAAVIALMIGAAVSRGPNSLIAGFTAFAQRVDGELITDKLPFFNFIMPKAVAFSHGQTPCVLDIETIRSGKHSLTFMRLTFELPQPASLSCHIVPQGMLSFVSSWLGAQDVRLGWDVFDDQFVVKTSDEQRAPEIIDRPVQEALLELKCFAGEHQPPRMMGSGYADLALRDNQLRLRVRGFFLEEQQMLGYYKIASRIFDQLAPRAG